MSNAIAESLRGQFRELSDAECLGLLRSKRLRRVAYDDAGPVVLPVSHVGHEVTVLYARIHACREALTT